MSTILAISSQVARGHVGLSAAVPAAQALGHDVIALPTVVLSNHPGHGDVAGQRIDPALLRQMLTTLDRHGWLKGVDAVLSGYLPTPEHVAVVAEAVALVRGHNPAVAYYCDPVLGDDPKGLYIAEDAARALAEKLVPMADVTFPNRFELEWLSSVPVTDVASAGVAAATLGSAWTIATSVPHSTLDDGTALATMAIGPDEAWLRAVARKDNVPNGTGDLFAALFSGYRLGGRSIAQALGTAVEAIEQVICASRGHDELHLVAILHSLNAQPVRDPASIPLSPTR
jgi:pyridoxine kinase